MPSRRFFLLGSAATAAVIARPARALLIDCGGPCANLAEQLVSIGKQIQSYATQVQQLWAEVNTYINTAWSIVSLPVQVWSAVQADLAMVRGIASAASLLTGNAGSIISRLQTGGAYLGSLAMTPTMLTNQFTMWQQTLGNSANNLGLVIQTSSNQEAGYTSQQNTAQLHSQSAVGQLQALQAGNELTGLVSTQLNQVHATITGVAQEIATNDAVNAERDALQDNGTSQFLNHTDTSWSAQEKY